jgi:hypothetical protein
MADTKIIERALVLNAFAALYPNTIRMADMPSLIREIEALHETGLDRFGMLLGLLQARGLETETRRTWSYMATFQRRHAQARARVDGLAPRTDENAIRFDQAKTEEIALNNAIQAAFEDAEQDLVSVLNMAGLDRPQAEALLSLEPGERLRYDKNDDRAEAFGELIELDLALNISSHYPAGALGITLSAAGDLVWRLVMGQRKPVR